jgi:hypothetical protein
MPHHLLLVGLVHEEALGAPVTTAKTTTTTTAVVEVAVWVALPLVDETLRLYPLPLHLPMLLPGMMR